MAGVGIVDDCAHGPSPSLCRTTRLKSQLAIAAILIFSLAACSNGCMTSDDSATQEMLRIPPWSLFRRTQCPPASLPETSFEKRSQQVRVVTAPCTCDAQLKILDLGSSRFPRYLPSVDCRVSAPDCSQGILCKERPYKVRVLRRRHLSNEDAGEEDEDSEEDDALPESLRSGWRFEEMDINFACDCKSFKFPTGRP